MKIVFVWFVVNVKMSFPVIKLEKSKECYECEIKKKSGSKFYCKRCNENHFVCVNCIPTYLKYEGIKLKGYQQNEFSSIVKNELRTY